MRRAITVSVAALLVAEPMLFVAIHRYCVPHRAVSVEASSSQRASCLAALLVAELKRPRPLLRLGGNFVDDLWGRGRGDFFGTPRRNDMTTVISVTYGNGGGRGI